MTDTVVRKLARSGVVARAGRGRYDLETSVRNVIAGLRKTVAHRGGAESLEMVRSERIRLTRAQPNAQEI